MIITLGQQPFEASMELKRVPSEWWPDYQRVKSSLDWILAAVLLFLVWPVILLSMIAVRLSSSGPPLYSQKRLGLRGRIITIYKVRTMYHDCERETGAVWCTPRDSRITWVGWFLRTSHLDELPQLYNVLCGDMSLIGPRPERPEIVSQLEKILPEYRRRLEVRPGLSGLAQILLAPDTDVDSVRHKLDLDLYYIEQVSPSMDFRILLATPLHIVRYPSHRIAHFFHLSFNGLARPKSESDAVQVEASCAG